MIKAKGIRKSFGDTEILMGIDIEVKAGEFVAIMGQSGCGKSTLLYSLSGMDLPSEGEILFQGKNIVTLSEKEAEEIRLRHMGFIFQKANFLKNLSIRDNIIFPAFQAGDRSRKQIVEEAERLMEKMGILHVAGHDIRRVSGGQLQRAAICRAMMNHPEILFGDEPTGALNQSATAEVMDILEGIHKEGTTILLVTHDANVAMRAERVVFLEDGAIKGELSMKALGGKEPENREALLKDWLSKMGF